MQHWPRFAPSLCSFHTRSPFWGRGKDEEIILVQVAGHLQQGSKTTHHHFSCAQREKLGCQTSSACQLPFALQTPSINWLDTRAHEAQVECVLPVHADDATHRPLVVATQQQLSSTLPPQRHTEVRLEAKFQQLLNVVKSIVEMNAAR